ncbi:hypothetical protein NIES21_31320 [Anabaenopsis circularis NIES-21]|uniref:Uncharacterized protein n=1 Tax=Anabaenopsis circularis NIES-21 TaxID=1085406 RepID=A0A1Z4GIY0_9CYAN|nr:hypothetical protein NIES21_31320 [Anabaenopsis circularis NIES-21]
MARLKRGSTILDKATRRIAGMRSISETLEFGDGLSLTEYERRIQTLQTKLSNYNMMLSTLDEAMGQIQLLEQDLSSYSEKMLMSVRTRYGKNSLQYVQAGGKLRQQNKRASTTAPTTTIMALNVENSTMNGKSTKTTVN